MRFRIPATLILAISALLSRVLGLVRDHLLARTFGASTGEGIYNLDAYYAAFIIPDLLYNLLIFGAISAAFIPIFTQYKKSGELKKAWSFASNMLHLLLVIILVVAAVVYLFAPYITKLVAGGFEPEAYDLTVRLLRIMLLSPIIFTFSAVFISIQDSFKSFFYRSLAPLFYNLGIILGILYFAADFGVVGVTWGVIIGAALQLLVQLPALKQLGYKHFWIFNYRRADARKAIKLIVPRVVGLSMNQITLVVIVLIASFLATGSITILTLANNLAQVPIGIVGISFAITSFATLSELAMEKSPTKFVQEIRRVTHRVLFLIIPATLGILFLRARIVDVILLAGKFTAADAALTAAVLGIFSLTLFTQSLLPLFSRGFYAYHDTKTPVVTSFVAALITIVGSYLLALRMGMGVIGIAIAYIIADILSFGLLYILMAKKCHCRILDWLKTFKIVLSAAFMYGVLYFVSEIANYGDRFIDQVGELAILTLSGLLSYFLAAWILKVPELKMITRR